MNYFQYSIKFAYFIIINYLFIIYLIPLTLIHFSYSYLSMWTNHFYKYLNHTLVLEYLFHHCLPIK
jgi:hypothetical protein